MVSVLRKFCCVFLNCLLMVCVVCIFVIVVLICVLVMLVFGRIGGMIFGVCCCWCLLMCSWYRGWFGLCWWWCCCSSRLCVYDVVYVGGCVGIGVVVDCVVDGCGGCVCVYCLGGVFLVMCGW